MGQRKQQLLEWIERLNIQASSVKPASADASFRRYFRISTNTETYIVMDAPPEQEDTRPFVNIARKFHQIGLNVPEVIEADIENGFLLLGDLGDRTYLNELNAGSVEGLYGDALSALMILQLGTNDDPNFLPTYSKQLLLDEMSLFRDWLLQRHLNLTLTDEQERTLQDSFQLLANNALQQPVVWVHRDYHSRNLMRTDRHNPGILDFQDAVCGAVTYDLVSLLKDCYIQWPREQVVRWVKGYHQLALDSGLQVTSDDDEFLRWFDLMGVQRHLKASGIFARLYHRDGKTGYLADIPRTLAYISQLQEFYPELNSLVKLVQSLDVKTANQSALSL